MFGCCVESFFIQNNILFYFQVTLLSFATYVLIDPKNVLDAKKAFVSLALFNMLAVPLTIFPEAISDFIQVISFINSYSMTI